MATLFKKASPSLAKLKQLFEAEAEQRKMLAAARWTPILRQALEAYEQSLEDVRKAYQIIFTATQRSNYVLWQIGIALPKRLERDSRGLLPPDKLERLYMVSPREYADALHEVGLKKADGYLAALYALARPGAGISEEDAKQRAEAASGNVKRLLTELESWSEKEIIMRSVETVDRKKAMAAFYQFSPDIAAGDTQSLISWAREHQALVMEGG